MNKLQKIAGVAALFEALIYISAFVFYGAYLNSPTSNDPVQKFAFLADNQAILSLMNLLIYVLFAIILAVLVLALHARLKTKSLVLSQMAAIFGIIWVALLIACGMISNIGLASVVELSLDQPEQAMSLWLALNVVTEGLGGGNEIVGGIWVFLLSYLALRDHELAKSLSYFGLLVGLAGIATIYPAELITEIFGITQIVWFIWLGCFLLRKN